MENSSISSRLLDGCSFLPTIGLATGAICGLGQRVIDRVPFDQSGCLSQSSNGWMASTVHAVSQTALLNNEVHLTMLVTASVAILSSLSLTSLRDSTRSVWNRCLTTLQNNPDIWRVAEVVTTLSLSVLCLYYGQDFVKSSWSSITLLAAVSYSLGSSIRILSKKFNNTLAGSLIVSSLAGLCAINAATSFKNVYEKENVFKFYSEAGLALAVIAAGATLGRACQFLGELAVKNAEVAAVTEVQEEKLELAEVAVVTEGQQREIAAEVAVVTEVQEEKIVAVESEQENSKFDKDNSKIRSLDIKWIGENYELVEKLDRENNPYEKYYSGIIHFLKEKKYSVIDLFNIESTYNNDLLLIKNKHGRNKIIDSFPSLFKVIDNKKIFLNKDFSCSRVPLFVIYCELLKIAASRADDCYQIIYNNRKLLKDGTKLTCFIGLMFSVYKRNISDEAVCKIIKNVFSVPENFTQACNSWKTVFKSYVCLKLVGEQIESKGENEDEMLKLSYSLVLDKISELAELEAINLSQSTFFSNCRDLSVAVALFKKLEYCSKNFQAGAIYFYKNRSKDLIRSMLSNKYYSVRYKYLDKDRLLTSGELNAWKKGSEQKLEKYTVVETDDPWDLLLGTTEVNGCQSIYNTDASRLGPIRDFVSDYSRIIAVKVKGKIVARCYIKLDVNGKFIEKGFYKNRLGRHHKDFELVQGLLDDAFNAKVTSMGEDWKRRG